MRAKARYLRGALRVLPRFLLTNSFRPIVNLISFLLSLMRKKLVGPAFSRSESVPFETTVFPEKLSWLVAAESFEVTDTRANCVVFNPSILALANDNLLRISATRNNRAMDFSWGYRTNTFADASYQSELATVSLQIGASSDDPLPPTVASKSFLGLPETASNDVGEFADSRIFCNRSGVFISWSQSDSGFLDGATHKIGVGRLNEPASSLLSAFVLDSPFGAKVEKNWMPVSDPESISLKFIYQVSPTISLTYADSTNPASPQTQTQGGPIKLENYRGGSPLHPFGESNQFLSVIHETRFFPTRHYVNRLASWREAEGGFQIDRFSPPFVLKRALDIEFACGLVVSNGRLFLSWGYRDREAWITHFDLEHIDGLLSNTFAPSNRNRI